MNQHNTVYGQCLLDYLIHVLDSFSTSSEFLGNHLWTTKYAFVKYENSSLSKGNPARPNLKRFRSLQTLSVWIPLKLPFFLEEKITENFFTLIFFEKHP